MRVRSDARMQSEKWDINKLLYGVDEVASAPDLLLAQVATHEA